MTPTTFRLIAQCATACPTNLLSLLKSKQRLKSETSRISRSQLLLAKKYLLNQLLYLNRYQQNAIPVVTSELHGQNSILTELHYILGISNTLVQTLTSNHFGNYAINGKIIKNQRAHAFLNIHLLLRKIASGTVKQQVSCKPMYNKQILWQENWKYFLVFFFPPPHDATAPSGPGPPHYRRFTSTLRHTTLGRTPMA